MGASMIRNAGALPLDDQNASIDPMSLVVRRGILLNVLNPKLTLFFFAFLPQFLDASPGMLDPKLIGLGGIFMLMTLVVFAVYAFASAAIRDLVELQLGSDRHRRWRDCAGRQLRQRHPGAVQRELPRGRQLQRFLLLDVDGRSSRRTPGSSRAPAFCRVR
jgi:hypothetical protein